MAKSKSKNKKKKFKKSNVINNINAKDLQQFTRLKVREQMQAEIQQSKREITEAVFQDIFVNLLGIPLLTLRNRGYGKKRLEEFYKEMMTIFADYHVQWLSSEDMAKAILDETGFDLLAHKQEFIEWLKSINLTEQAHVYSSK